MSEIYAPKQISALGKASLAGETVMWPVEQAISINAEELLQDVYTALETSAARLDYQLAGGCSGPYITKGSFSDVVDQCRSRGVSYIIYGLEASSGILGKLALDFENHCFCDATINAFISTVQSQPSPLHYDYHDLLNVQLLGQKHWKIFAAADDVTFPISGYVINENTTRRTVFDGEIKTGTMYTIPKGSAHVVSTASDISVHIAIGLKYKSVADLVMRLLSGKLANHTTPVLSILNNVSELADLIASLDLSLSQVGKEDLVAQILSLQKLLPIGGTDDLRRIDRLIFDRGAFYFENKCNKIDIKFPLMVNRVVTIVPASFSPGLLSLPIELSNVVAYIVQFGEIDRKTLLKEFDDDSASAILDLFYKTGLASNADIRELRIPSPLAHRM